MAIRYSADKLLAVGKDRVVLHGAFRPNGASGVLANSKKGIGFSVARTSVGLYRITLDSPWPKMLGARAEVRSAVGTHGDMHMVAYSAANGTIDLRIRRGAPPQIWLPISMCRALSGGDYQNTAATGGLLTTNTTPILQRTNAGTDIAARLTWAATVVTEVQWDSIPIPNACETANAATVSLWIDKNGNTDVAATVAAKVFVGFGGSNIGGNTAALASATLARQTVALTAVNLGAGPNFMNVSLVPSAHANDAIRLYGANVEFETLEDLASDPDNEISFELMMCNSVSNY